MITLYGGKDEIGGNKILVESRKAKISVKKRVSAT